MNEKLLTAKEVADLLGISKETVMRLARLEKISSIQVGPKLIRFKSKAVADYVASHTVDAK